MDFNELVHKVYQDGELITSVNSPGDATDWIPTDFSQLQINIGRKVNSTSNINAWHGKIDEVGIWNRPLSENEIQHLFQGLE